MIPVISPLERQLLGLVRASLWNVPADESLFLTTAADWHKIGKLAMQQTVGILVIEGALSLPEYLLPPKEWIQKALTFIEANRRTHILVDGCVAEVIAGLRDKGIDAVLLKGQAYARTYPKPELRQCGDIDIYVGEKKYHSAYEAAKMLKWESEENFVASQKHYGCYLHGVRIELHRIAGQLLARCPDRNFQEWSHTQIVTGESMVVIADKDIPLPTPLFDVVFVFHHLYHHFLCGGIGLRHICDWVMLLHTHKDEIERVELERRLKDFRLMSAWRSFAPIAVNHLGLPEAECPFYSERYAKHAERILRLILKEGNFGRAKERLSHPREKFFARKLYAAKRIIINHTNKIEFDPVIVMRSLLIDLLLGACHTLRSVIKGEWR